MATNASRKVARAARSGGSSFRSNSTPVGYYATLMVIVALGALLVGFSRAERVAESTPGTVHPYSPVINRKGETTRPADNWFSAYGFYVCDRFYEPINPEDDPTGITTKGDGIIHISPKKKNYSGKNADFGLFADSIGVKVTKKSLKLPDGSEFKGGTKCGEKNGKLVVKEWINPSDPNSGEVIEAGAQNLLLKDGAAVTVAFVPEDTDPANIVLPESVPQLDKLRLSAATSAGGTNLPIESLTNN